MRGLLVVAFGALACMAYPAAAAEPAKRPASRPAAQAAAPEPAPETVAQLAAWAKAAGDNRGLPFMVIDKQAARVFVYAKDGTLSASTPALLGFAIGDESTPGIGDRELSDIAPEERTTPAGRFMAAYGRGPDGKTVFWVDYDTAISLHPVATAQPRERRLERLRSPTATDNRITFGCINVPAAFYQQHVRRTFAAGGVVYILPEVRSLAAVFPTFAYTLASQTLGVPVADTRLAGSPPSQAPYRFPSGGTH
jgi:hypothetical protein